MKYYSFFYCFYSIALFTCTHPVLPTAYSIVSPVPVLSIYLYLPTPYYLPHTVVSPVDTYRGHFQKWVHRVLPNAPTPQRPPTPHHFRIIWHYPTGSYGHISHCNRTLQRHHLHFFPCASLDWNTPNLHRVWSTYDFLRNPCSETPHLSWCSKTSSF